jgi:hypothetical protein
VIEHGKVFDRRLLVCRCRILHNHGRRRERKIKGKYMNTEIETFLPKTDKDVRVGEINCDPGLTSAAMPQSQSSSSH